MKLLFDQNLSFKLCGRLADLFPGSSQARLLKLHQVDDRIIWQFAKDNGFVVVSFDADFAEMAALFNQPPKVIWLRRGNQTTSATEALLRDHAGTIAAFEHDDTACLELY